MSSKKTKSKDTTDSTVEEGKKSKNTVTSAETEVRMNEANREVLKIWAKNGEEAAVSHMLKGRSYAEMRSVYG